MTESSPTSRRFNDEEVALIIKRAAELQQSESVASAESSSLTLGDVEQIAREAGIDASLIRRAAQSLDRPAATNRPSPWAGAPTRLVFERVVDGEILVDDFETLVNEMRRTMGDNGVASVLGRTLAWSSTTRARRRRQSGRQVDLTVSVRGGLTTIRVEEELGSLAGGLFGGLVGGGGGGTSGITMGVGIGVFHSVAMAGLVWAGVVGSFYVLARTIFRNISAKREAQLGKIADRLEEMVTDSVVNRARIAPSPPLPLLPRG
ncbi:MAG: hypothetical protein ABIS03_05330 [Gemmatimonadaceae bacterium]